MTTLTLVYPLERFLNNLLHGVHEKNPKYSTIVSSKKSDSDDILLPNDTFSKICLIFKCPARPTDQPETFPIQKTHPKSVTLKLFQQSTQARQLVSQVVLQAYCFLSITRLHLFLRLKNFPRKREFVVEKHIQS